MKQIKSFLCLALALAFAASCNQNNNTTAPNGESSSPAAGSIVYIQLDSIVSKYDMYNTLKSELEIKVQKIQNDLQARGRALENEQKDFSNKMNKGLMTQAEAEEKYRVLNNKMSDYQNLGARKEAEIQEENAVMMNKVMDAIEQYIKKYNDEKKYALILTGVFEGDPKLDITNDIIEGLNNEYVKNKKKGTQTEEAAAEESAPEAEKK